MVGLGNVFPEAQCAHATNVYVNRDNGGLCILSSITRPNVHRTLYSRRLSIYFNVNVLLSLSRTATVIRLHVSDL